MRTGAAAGHPGYFHEIAPYGSDEQLLQLVGTFMQEGSESGEPTFVAFGERTTDQLHDTFGTPTGVEYLTADSLYQRPAATIESWRRIYVEQLAMGASQIRAVGEVPLPAPGASWEDMVRYEAVVNHAFADFPVWGICVHDTRSTPEDVLQQVWATHPHVVTADGRHVNEHYCDPVEFLAARTPPGPDPLEQQPPLVELRDPSPVDARREVNRLARRTRLDDGEVAGLLTAVSEAVTNTLLHGLPPTEVCAWAGDDRVVVTVHDRGAGPDDPFVGLLPSPRVTGGRGLWIAHQVCAAVDLCTDDAGFTVRLVAGHPVSGR